MRNIIGHPMTTQIPRAQLAHPSTKPANNDNQSEHSTHQAFTIYTDTMTARTSEPHGTEYESRTENTHG